MLQYLRDVRWRLSRYRQQWLDADALRNGNYKEGTRDRKFHDREYPVAPLPENACEGMICLCDGKFFHGGLTDRLRGILSSYKAARSRNIPFYIHWTAPFHLTDYLQPVTFDWQIPDKEIFYSRPASFPIIIEDTPDCISRKIMKAALKIPVRQYHVYSNSDDACGEYSELYREIFKPSPKVKQEVAKHRRVLGEEYYVFTTRFLQLLGDFKDWQQDTLAGDAAIGLMKKVADEMLRLMRKIPKDCRVLLTSDSRRFLDYAVGLDERIYVVPGEVKNIDLEKEQHPDAWLKTFVDQQLIMGARKVTLLRTGKMYPSGFPRFAAEVGGAKFIDHAF